MKHVFYLIMICTLVMCCVANAQTPVITNLAGNYLYTFPNPSSATFTQLNRPAGLAIDNKGNLYINDTRDFAVRKLNLQTSILSPYAGNGEPYTVNIDNSMAIDASFDLIGEYFSFNSGFQYSLYVTGGIAADKYNNLYLAERFTIYKVDTNGLIHTFAGNGELGNSGNGVPATAASFGLTSGICTDNRGNVYLSDLIYGKVRKIDANGYITDFAGNDTLGYSGDGGQATSAELMYPMGLCADANNNIIIADMNGYVRKVDTNGIISTLVSPANGLIQPVAVCTDKHGNLFIDDYSQDKIWKVDTALHIKNVAGNGILPFINSNIVQFAGDGGPATKAAIYYPYGIAVDTIGNLFLCDYVNNRVRKVDTNGIITTIAGNSCISGNMPATDACFQTPQGIVTDTFGNIYFNDQLQQVVRKIDTNGIITTIAGTGLEGNYGNDVAATKATFENLGDIAISKNGDLYITDILNNCIRKIDHQKGLITYFAGNGSNSSKGDSTPALGAYMNQPEGIVFDSSGNLFVANNKGSFIQKIDANTGYIYVVAGGHSSSSGYSGDGGPATLAALAFPQALAIDKEQNLYIADIGNGVVRKIDAVTGIITTYAGNYDSLMAGAQGYENMPATAANIGNVFAIAIDDSDNLYLSGWSIISKVSKSTGIITTICGNTNPGMEGYGGPAINAEIGGIGGMCFNKKGDLVFTDELYHLVNKINLSIYDTNIKINNGNGNSNNIHGLTLYPNPNNGNFTIGGSVNATDNSKILQVTIYDVPGRKLYETNGIVAGNAVSIPVYLNEAIANGVYFCHVRGGDINSTFKFVVKR